jgi:hypothetical protein
MRKAARMTERLSRCQSETGRVCQPIGVGRSGLLGSLRAADRAIDVSEGTNLEVPGFVALQSAASFAETAFGVLGVSGPEALALRTIAVAEGTPQEVPFVVPCHSAGTLAEAALELGIVCHFQTPDSLGVDSTSERCG